MLYDRALADKATAVVADALPSIGRAPASAGRRLAPLRARPAALGVSVSEQQSHYCDTEQNKTDRAHAVLPVHFIPAASFSRTPSSRPRVSQHSRASACSVAVIATPGTTAAALAAKAATTTIPIVFGVDEDPVKLGLVASLAHPGGNATGINFFLQELVAKRLGLLHELVPKAVRIAVLVNPVNAPSAEATLRDAPEAARAIGLQIQVLNASTSREIEAAFATIVRDRADALFVAPDGFFVSRRVQFATLAARYGIPTVHAGREEVEAGGLVSCAQQ